MEYFLRDFLLAAVPSSVSKTIAAPLEAVKLRAQLSDPSGSSSILEMVNVMYQEEGLGVFFAGNCANCARYYPVQMTNFLFKDLIKRLVEKSLGEGYLSKILVGTLAGTLSTLMVYPLDNWRTQALSKSECSSGMESSSLFDVYSGFGMSVLGIGLYRFSYFAVHDAVKPILKSFNAGLWGRVVFNMGVSSFAGLVVYPVDTIRRRQMMNPTLSVVDAASMGGFSNLWAGAGINVLRGIFGTLALIGYDQVKSAYLGSKRATRGGNDSNSEVASAPQLVKIQVCLPPDVTQELIDIGTWLDVQIEGVTYNVVVPKDAVPSKHFDAVVNPANPRPQGIRVTVPAVLTSEQILRGAFVIHGVMDGIVFQVPIPPHSKPGGSFFWHLDKNYAISMAKVGVRVPDNATEEMIAKGQTMIITVPGSEAPFSVIIPLGSKPGGMFTAMVNPQIPNPNWGVGVRSESNSDNQVTTSTGTYWGTPNGWVLVPAGTKPKERFVFPVYNLAVVSGKLIDTSKAQVQQEA